MDIKDIAVGKLTYDLLYENGALDAREGKSMQAGWQECAKECGYDSNRRTPAQEAYNDGWYSVPPEQRNAKKADDPEWLKAVWKAS